MSENAGIPSKKPTAETDDELVSKDNREFDSNRRKIESDGKLTAVGSTVDIANATWTNTIGDPELITVWTDPDFNPAMSAFYCARVLEIPTPRWTAYDARHYGIKISPEVPMVIQERAYTSPIWYTASN